MEGRTSYEYPTYEHQDPRRCRRQGPAQPSLAEHVRVCCAYRVSIMVISVFIELSTCVLIPSELTRFWTSGFRRRAVTFATICFRGCDRPSVHWHRDVPRRTCTLLNVGFRKHQRMSYVFTRVTASQPGTRFEYQLFSNYTRILLQGTLKLYATHDCHPVYTSSHKFHTHFRIL